MNLRKTSQHASNDVFTAIAHPIRRGILSRLVQGEVTVTTLSANFADVSRPAISQHLGILLESGLVKVDRRGRENYYSLRPENLYEVQRWLSQFEHL